MNNDSMMVGRVIPPTAPLLPTMPHPRELFAERRDLAASFRRLRDARRSAVDLRTYSEFLGQLADVAYLAAADIERIDIPELEDQTAATIRGIERNRKDQQ